MSEQKKGPVNIKKPAYAMEMSADGSTATLTLYGDVVETRPIDWWTDEPVAGDFICQDEFLEDLKAIEGASTVTVRINSLGGDASVGLLIHNRLRELARGGAKLNGIVDGVAMSAGSVILAACDHVSVNPSSLIMIHRAATILWGYYNKDELTQEATSLGKWDEAMVAAYKRKCGLSENEIEGMLSETTYMTGRDAVDKGFADELIEDAEPTQIAASADGKKLFVNGKAFHLAPGMFAPDTVPTVKTGTPAPDKTNKTPENTGKEKGGSIMTLEEFRAQNPEEATKMDEQAASAMADAVKAERQRLHDIDKISGALDPEAVREAKYGEKPMTAAELALAALEKDAQAGKKHLADMTADHKESGAGNVGSAHDGGEPEAKDQQTPEARMSAARASVKALLGKNGKEEK